MIFILVYWMRHCFQYLDKQDLLGNIKLLKELVKYLRRTFFRYKIMTQNCSWCEKAVKSTLKLIQSFNSLNEIDLEKIQGT